MQRKIIGDKYKKSEERAFVFKVFWICVTAPLALIVLLLITVRLGLFGALPTFEDLESPNSSIASEVYSDKGQLIGKFYIKNRKFIDYDELSPYLVEALISTEDERFKQHSGIDFESLGRVFIKTIILGQREGGGSTISQQLAKNLYPRDDAASRNFIVRGGKLMVSKIKEWITAVMLERNYSKQEILSMYLNVVEYGSNSYGIHAASQTFFNKKPSELTVEESAVLIGLVNAPTRYSPVRNPENSLERRNLVLTRMKKNGFLNKEELDSLLKMPIVLDYKPLTHNDGSSTYFRAMLSKYMTATKPRSEDYYSDWDYKVDKKLWNEDPLYGWCNKNKKADSTNYNIYRDGLRIYTTINVNMQKYAEMAVYHHMKSDVQPRFNKQIKSRKSIFSSLSEAEQTEIIKRAIKQTDRYRELDRAGYSYKEIEANFKKKYPMKIFSYDDPMGKDTVMSPWDSIYYHKSIMRASFVAIEPITSHIKAYVGGTDFRFFKYDMAMQGKRQVGSTIKPFIYTFAVDYLGIDPCTPVPNDPMTVNGWSPKDDGVTYDGVMHPLWWGLANSRNNYSTWIIKQSNYRAVAELIHKLGIHSRIDPVPSMCLGPSDISLYEMVAAYNTFANRGIYVRPQFVTRIEDRYGNRLATFASPSNDAISPKSAYTILQMMRKVVDSGTGGRLRWMYGIGGDVAGKTGTTNNASDCWFIGLTPKIVGGAWVGGDDRSIHLNGNAQGATLALPIFAEFIKRVYNDPSLGISQNDRFAVPEGGVHLDCSKSTFEDEIPEGVEENIDDEFFN
ncbi:MAG: transglycosylase domain-containing protein [Rikenellaceae bacterium]